MSHILVIDNRDSFVYNLVDACATAGHNVTVVRNDVTLLDILSHAPDLIVTSPGPGHPRDPGVLMEVTEHALERDIPILGICLGFQALMEANGRNVVRCGPIHGMACPMELTKVGQKSGLFPTTSGEQTVVPVARYHSLGCTEPAAGWETLGTGEGANQGMPSVVMAAGLPNQNGGWTALGLQFHPESILSPTGPLILDNCFRALIHEEENHLD